MPASSLRVVARIKGKPEKVGEVRELLRGLVEPTRKESGCVSYDVASEQRRSDGLHFRRGMGKRSSFRKSRG